MIAAREGHVKKLVAEYLASFKIEKEPTEDDLVKKIEELTEMLQMMQGKS